MDTIDNSSNNLELKKSQYENYISRQGIEADADQAINELSIDLQENLTHYRGNPLMQDMALKNAAWGITSIRRFTYDLNAAALRAREAKLGQPIPPGLPEESSEHLASKPSHRFDLQRLTSLVSRVFRPGPERDRS